MTIPDVLPIAQKVYDRHVAGCCAHIVLDDQNVKKDDVYFCLNQAIELGHKDCEELCRCLLQLSRTQLLKLGNLVDRV